MDNKKLMRILLRDVTELQELVAGMKISETYDPFEVELLFTRISGVRHMLEVVSDAVATTQKQEVERPDREMNKESFVTENRAVVYEEPSVKVPIIKAEISREEAPVRKPEPVVPLPKPEIKVEEPVPSQPEASPTLEETKTSDNEDIDNDDMELEEEIVTEGPQTLGEKFSHGKSVNDLLLEQGKTDSKFSKLPVVSLQSAIGINDRFLFTRELFEGKSDAFAETIKKIDSFDTIHDAAVYLRENFKWKRNETSLKFIDLVKRKFL